MLPMLYDFSNINAKKIGGYGKMAEIVECSIHEELNGEYSMSFKYPVTGALYKQLLTGGTVTAFGPARHGEFFDIYKHSVPIDGLVTFECQHASRRLAHALMANKPDWTKPLTTTSMPTLQPVTDSYTSNIHFSITSHVTQAGNVVVTAPKTLLSWFIGEEESFVSCGVDVAFISGKYGLSQTPEIVIHTYDRRGADNGVQFRFGYNLVDIEFSKDEGETFNAFLPFWDDGLGNYTYASQGGNNAKIVTPSTPITPIKAVLLDCTSAFQTTPTSAQLVSYAQNILDVTTPWVPEKTVNVNINNGIEIDPHGADIQLGDTVHVYWTDAGIEETMRVISYDYDVLGERYSNIALGTKPTNFVAVTGIDAAGGGGSGGAAAISPYDNTPAPLGTAAAGSSDNYARGDHVHAYPEFTYLGSSSNSSTTVTYPSTAKEILIKGKTTHAFDHAYFNVVPASAISNVSIIGVGGYYYGSSDFGYANVNHDAANRTLAFRNIRYASVTTGTFYFYYR